MRAYGTSRAVDRRATALRHALDPLAHASGAMDALCGRIVLVPLGDWDPTHPFNCRTCATILAAEGDRAA